MAPKTGASADGNSVDKEAGTGDAADPMLVESPRQTCSQGPAYWCSVRLQITMVMFLSVGVMVTARTSFSLALVCMVNHTALAAQGHGLDLNASVVIGTNVTSTGCMESSVVEPEESREDGPYAWDKETQGLLLSALLWSYTITQLPGAVLTRHVGERMAIGVGTGGASLLTLLVPLGASLSPWCVLALRAGVGGFQGIVTPAIFGGMVSRWSPPRERERFLSVSLSGQYILNALCLPVFALLCKTQALAGWPSVFYVQGALSVLVTAACFLAVRDSPACHPWISKEEQRFIASSLGREIPRKEPPVPWRSVLTSRPVLAITLARVAFNWGYYLFLTTLPQYLREVLQVDIAWLGMLSMLPYFCMLLTVMAASVTSGLLISRRMLSVLAVRKLLTLFGLGAPAALVLGLSFLDCGQTGGAVVLLCGGVGLLGLNFSGYLVNIFDVAPVHATSVQALTNCLATALGVLAPYVVALLTPDRTREQWQTVFYLTCGIFVLGTATFLAFAEGSVQAWDCQEKTPPK